jgi:hypothetical protein
LNAGKPTFETEVAGFFTSYRAAETVSHQIIRPAGVTKVYERAQNGGMWGVWARTDAGALNGAAENAAAALNVRNVGTFSTSLDSFVADKGQLAYSTFFGYAAGSVGKPTGDTGAGFFTSEVGASTSVIHQTFRPIGTTRVWERYSSNGGSAWNPAWTRTDADALNVRNVGNIAPGAITSSNLDNFAQTYSQPAGSTYHAYFTSGLSGGNWPVNAAGFFTSYVGTISTAWTNYVSRQEYRPVTSNTVYQRTRNGGSWSAWATFVTSDVQSISGIPMQVYSGRLIISTPMLVNPTTLVGRAVRVRGTVNNLPSSTSNGTLTTMNGLSGSWVRIETVLYFEVSGTLSTGNGGPNSGWLWLSGVLPNVETGTTYSGTATLIAW